jgi:hypothetical protein
MLKNSSYISHYLSNLWMNISGNKQIVYQPKIFSIRSLFVSFRLVWHRIVDTKMNTTITYNSVVKREQINELTRWSLVHSRTGQTFNRLFPKTREQLKLNYNIRANKLDNKKILIFLRSPDKLYKMLLKLGNLCSSVVKWSLVHSQAGQTFNRLFIKTREQLKLNYNMRAIGNDMFVNSVNI